MAISAGDTDTYLVLAITPDGPRALELVDDGNARPIPWHEQRKRASN